MTEVTPEQIAALQARGEIEAEEKSKPREKSINWNKTMQEGDMLAGIMERGGKVQTPTMEQPSYLMEIRDHETGDLYVVWCGNYQLKQAIIEKAPAEGGLVVVQYHGKQVLDNGRTMKVFTVEPERSDHPYWHDIDQVFWKKQQEKGEKAAVQVQVPTYGPDEAPF